MREVTRELLTLPLARLTRRQQEFAAIWFGPTSPNSWAREYIYGIEPNPDLGLATKVNMILHGDGSTNVFVTSGLLPFGDYVSGGRAHALSVSKTPEEHPYSKPLNEEFDFVFTNPPFSITLSEEEKRKLARSFELATDQTSESLFLERWYQLLREGARAAAILPESVFDTATALNVRLFLYAHFRVEALVALPYIAFKPYTSTKTCVVIARKKTAEEVHRWRTLWDAKSEEFRQAQRDIRSATAARVVAGASVLLNEQVDLTPEGEAPQEHVDRALELARNGDFWVFGQVVAAEGVDYPIFMAEPENVGYKRRKGLEDLPMPNDLLRSAGEEDRPTVLDTYRQGPVVGGDGRFGFWVRLRDIGARPALRCDPKYHLLWTHRRGRVFEDYNGPTERIRDLLVPAARVKVTKGPLPEASGLIDLADVEGRTSVLLNVTEVDEIGSDKVAFGNADLAISKLEPYLGKVLRNIPEESWIGSTEWLLYDCSERVAHVDYVRFLLLLPQMLEAYRCLQSGKRHARFTEDDFLDLLVPALDRDRQVALAEMAGQREAQMLEFRTRAVEARQGINLGFVAELYALGPGPASNGGAPTEVAIGSGDGEE